ncbi:Elastase inhibitor AFLEI Flags: Precursor [Lysobacter sp. KIS68-7]|uniref:I78 family peptidase inhibitor n=1 Tax=Lysobacter sp. KIS68-7 TaxID=2904252 RepID=UPI001E358015|nr:I78 family peptidase inhibitor [Lysobacter sp. KIS68-7]UHQ20522.1 Elastase inhibitor AFLEI Flags: Precursor [Lysobacter sp. KIS68-7]
MRLHPAPLSLVLVAVLGLGACATKQDTATAAQDAAPVAGDSSKLDMPIENAPAHPATYAMPEPAATCNADAAHDAVGKKATDEVVEKARVAAGAATTRVVRPNQPVTMDYRGDRLNVQTDAKDKIVGTSCG